MVGQIFQRAMFDADGIMCACKDSGTRCLDSVGIAASRAMTKLHSNCNPVSCKQKKIRQIKKIFYTDIYVKK